MVDLDIPRIYVWNLNDIKRFICCKSNKSYLQKMLCIISEFLSLDAAVVCRSLGFGGGEQTWSSFFGSESNYFMDDVQCTGKLICCFRTWISLAMIALKKSWHYLMSKMYSVKVQEYVYLQFYLFSGNESSLFSCKYTVIDTPLSVYIQFYLFSGSESRLFSCKYTDIDTPLSVYLQFNMFPGSESSLFSCPYNPKHNCGPGETAGVKCT